MTKFVVKSIIIMYNFIINYAIMKQKRKVKSLINKNGLCNFSALTSLLIWLWVGFCICSAALLSVSISEAADSTSYLQFNWLADKNLKIYHLNLVNPSDLSHTEAEMYIDSNSTFHITPASIVTNLTDWARDFTYDNKVDDWLYSNILWWNIQEVHSNNVTLIWWRLNNIVAWNDNATILWWVDNVYWAGNWTPMVVVWWTQNIMYWSHNWNAIIWWNHNVIWWNVTNWFILWWSNNEVLKNSWIVAWKNVKLNKENAFVYSNSSSDFTPLSDNAFYLNADGWVWINVDSSKKWVSVDWVVDFGDIQWHTCTSSNIWEFGSFNGCLIGCTNKSMNQWNLWELLDRWKRCEQICSSSPSCYFEPEVEITVPDYTSFCTAKTVSRAHMCNNVTNLYKNVVYESKLIDSEAECPSDEHDKCIFQCDQWSHIFYDGYGKPSCKLDCVLPWSSTWAMIKHWETVVWYKAGEVSCSNDAWRNIPDSCTRYKTTLTCNDGNLWVADQPGGYIYWSCNLTNYTCDTSEYNLSQSDISTISKDTVSSWNDTDRRETQWAHWVYKLCKDYTSNWYDVCTTVNRHYKLVRCQNGYSVWALHPYECRKKCYLDWSSYDDWQEILGYRSSSASCPSACESTKLTCNNWNWIWDATTYSKKTCSLSAPSCPSANDVPSITVLENRTFSIYNEWCQVYSPYGNKHCVKGDIKFDLIWCIDWYHTESGNPIYNKYCVPNSKQVKCIKQWAPSRNATYDYYDVTINWIWEWNNWHWETVENCSWHCNNNYHLETQGYVAPGVCVSNSASVQCDDSWYIPSHASFTIKNVTINRVGQWNNWRWQDPSACDWSCNSDHCWTSCQYTYQDCSENWKPDHSSYVHSTICWWGSCDWTCDSWYHYSNWGCAPDCPATAKFGEYCCSTTTCVDSQWDPWAPSRFCSNNRCVECTTQWKDTCTRSDTSSTCCTAEGECTYWHSFCS